MHTNKWPIRLSTLIGLPSARYTRFRIVDPSSTETRGRRSKITALKSAVSFLLSVADYALTLWVRGSATPVTMGCGA